MNTRTQFFTLSALISTLTLTSGCGFFVQTITTQVAIDFYVDGEGDSYSNVELVNPNENEDVAANREHIQETNIREIVFSVEGIRENNRAFSGSGEIYVRKVGEEWPTAPVATFEETPVEIGQTKVVAVTPEDIAFVEELLSDVFEVRIDGHVDQGPLAFDGRLTFDLDVEVGF